MKAIRNKPLDPSMLAILAMVSPYKSEVGSVCRFVPVNDSVGVKLYANRKIRDICFTRQEIAWGEQVGPKCWHCFTVRWCGVNWHGFFTESVKVGQKLLNEGVPGDEVEKKRKHLEFRMNEVFNNGQKLEWTDVSYDNFGRLPNGNWVVIDFSHFEDELGDLKEIRPKWRSHMERHRSMRRMELKQQVELAMPKGQ